jgi:hypothetical protein
VCVGGFQATEALHLELRRPRRDESTRRRPRPGDRARNRAGTRRRHPSRKHQRWRALRSRAAASQAQGDPPPAAEALVRPVRSACSPGVRGFKSRRSPLLGVPGARRLLLRRWSVTTAQRALGKSPQRGLAPGSHVRSASSRATSAARWSSPPSLADPVDLAAHPCRVTPVLEGVAAHDEVELPVAERERRSVADVPLDPGLPRESLSGPSQPRLLPTSAGIESARVVGPHVHYPIGALEGVGPAADVEHEVVLADALENPLPCRLTQSG